jgi:multisubunit Na+/H+ antiporter MnhB subunit
MSHRTEGAEERTEGTGSNRRAIIELVLAVAAAAGSVFTWLAAHWTVTLGPILAGEPSMTSVVYSPPRVLLALLLAAIAGILAVVGIARLRRFRSVSTSQPR